MHTEAYEGFGWLLGETGIDVDAPLNVLDIGGQNVNGTVHDYFSNSRVTTLDLENADIIADARYWDPTETFDLVIATEVFEHVEHWPMIVSTARRALVNGGHFLTTCASTSRPQHGATGAPLPAEGEWYNNVDPDLLKAVMTEHFSAVNVHYRYPPGDAYAWARV